MDIKNRIRAEEIKIILSHHDKGLTAKKISILLGVSPPTARNVLKLMNEQGIVYSEFERRTFRRIPQLIYKLKTN